MRVTGIIITALSAVTAVYADDAGTICTNAGFNDCTGLGFHGDNTCSNLGKHFTDSISSFIINPGFTCFFFDNTNCNTNQGELPNQTGQNSDLSGIGWNDRIASYICNV